MEKLGYGMYFHKRFQLVTDITTFKANFKLIFWFNTPSRKFFTDLFSNEISYKLCYFSQNSE